MEQIIDGPQFFIDKLFQNNKFDIRTLDCIINEI